MKTALGFGTAAGMIVGAGYWVLSSLEYRNKQSYKDHMNRLERSACHIPQNSDGRGEEIAASLGNATESLQQWRAKSWIERAFFQPPQPTIEEANAALRQACHEGHRALAEWLMDVKENNEEENENDEEENENDEEENENDEEENAEARRKLEFE